MRTEINYLLAVLILLTVLFSCKKEKNTTGNNNNPTNQSHLPTVTTSVVSAITKNTAKCGGTITSDGGSAITAGGVCWSTSSNSGQLNPGNYTTDIIATGGYTSNITGLMPNTTYYVRAYASNSIGTAYGNEISFTTATAPTGITIGADYQGGIIAYILQAGDPGYSSSVAHGFVVAPTDQCSSNPGIISGNSDYIANGTTGTGIGTGSNNTSYIISYVGTGNYASKLCYDLVLGGYSNWYLPSKDELNKIYLNKATIGGISNADYWSSSIDHTSNGFYVWIQNFYNGSQSPQRNYYTSAVRAIHSF